MWEILLVAAQVIVAFPAPEMDLHPRPTGNCTAPEYRQVDFWLGRWDSYDAKGKLQGHTTVDKVAGGCALLQTWVGIDGSAGNSFIMFDATRKIWNQTWLTDRGNVLPLEGYWQGGTMVLLGFHVGPNGKNQLHRTLWRPTPNGAYQLCAYSEDGGTTWIMTYEGYLHRVEKAQTRK